MDRPLKIAIVGCGLIGPRHAEAVLARPDTELVALVDPFPRAQAVAAELGTAYYASIAAMLAAGVMPDAAVVATSNATHVPVAAELAAAGVHLLVEKPLSPWPADCKALMEHVERCGVKMLVGHHRRFNPYIEAARASLGRIGTLVGVSGTWCLRKNPEYFAQAPWRCDRAAGGGALLINLVHDVDLLQYLCGPIVRVYAEAVPKQRPEFDVDEGAALTLRFASGAVGTFLCADNANSAYNFESGTGENVLIAQDPLCAGFYRLFGTDGALSVPDMTLQHQPATPAETKGWWTPLERESVADAEALAGVPFQLQLGHLVRVVRGEEEPRCTAADGMAALLVIEAVVRSLETGTPQAVTAVAAVEANTAALNR
ncbi:oxidoreductase [Dipodascopsis tothii]|uniref:oxidoreductase n=1 Tax=Dipodascopsis tothii TaxID=44089 RepID=UPI0034D00F0E